MVKRRSLYLAIIILAPLAAVPSCDLWLAPETQEGRSSAPTREILVVHSLAETLSSVELTGDGAFYRSSHDIVQLGSVPNDIGLAGYELTVTLSGENRVLFLDRVRLFQRESIDLGTSVNPMQTKVFGSDSSVFATTGLFSAQAHLRDRSGTELLPSSQLQTGSAPQAILPLADSGGDQNAFRLVVANTGYSTSRPSDIPFGPATLSVFNLTLSGTAATPQVSLVSSSLVGLEEEGHDPDTESGFNPVALVDMNEIDTAINEVLVIGAGINYGSDGSGADDGSLLVLDRTTLAVKQRIPLGGSPGAAIVMECTDGSLVLFAAGPDGIRSVQRGPGAPAWTNEWDAMSVKTVYTATGGVPFLADIVAFGSSVFVADFGNNRILRFHFDRSTGTIDGPRETQSVSAGPVALLILEWEG